MSQSIKPENSSTLKPIEDVLESISFSNKSNVGTSNKFSSQNYSLPSSESITSSFTFKIIIFLVILLVGIVGYTYLEKEVNKLIDDIKNYFETKKYEKEEKEIEKEKEKEEKETKEKTTEEIIKDTQSDIQENKKNKKNEEPVNYTSSTKLNVSALEESENVEEYQKDALQKALNDASERGGEVVPDGSQRTSKKGWCFIGADNLSRTCAEIGVNDICMSGEIYPTKDVCINPNLRA